VSRNEKVTDCHMVTKNFSICVSLSKNKNKVPLSLSSRFFEMDTCMVKAQSEERAPSLSSAFWWV